MADFYNSTLIDEIKDKIKSNSNRGITGDILQSKLLEIVNALDLGGIFLGFATTSTNPSTQGTSKANGFYFSDGAGTYINFKDSNSQSLVIGEGLEIIYREIVNDNLAWNHKSIASNVNISGKADKVSGATSGNFAGLDASGNLTDSGSKASDFVPTPSTSGTEGQILVNNGNGGTVWENIIQDNGDPSPTKTWSSDKISPVYDWAMGKINEEYLSKFSVSVYSFSGQNYFTDEATQTTMTLTIDTKYNSASVPADTPLPNGWDTTGTTGRYSSSVTGSSGTIGSATFYYTIPNIGRASGSSPAKSITSTSPAYWGVVPSNDPNDINTYTSLWSEHRLTSGTGSNPNPIDIPNTTGSTAWLWVLAKGDVTATQSGNNILSQGILAPAFHSPRPGHTDIQMNGYRLYISGNNMAAGKGLTSVTLKINLN